MGIYDPILESVSLPKMYRVRQDFDRECICDIQGTVRKEICRFPRIAEVKGKEIALAVGSRGISSLQQIVKTTIGVLKEHGAKVFIVPAMGSHGGAISENQKKILTHLGITEEVMGVEVRATMETVCIGYTPEGVPVYFDKNAAGADYTVSIARIKPHCSFRGKYESGMVKMSVIGLGKQKGADYCHMKGMANMGVNLEKIGRVHMEKSNLLFCLGLMENAYDDICMIRVFGREQIMVEEPALLERAKFYLPKIPFKNLDILIVDEIGKNITGTGMDCNIIQRFTSEHMPAQPFTKRLVVLDITEESDGNASGLGLADIVSRRAFEKMSFEKTYPNNLTARTTAGCKVPMIMENDFDVIRAGIKTAPDVDYSAIRAVRIKNTLRLDEMEISEALVAEAKRMEKISGDWKGFYWNFDRKGNLVGKGEEDKK
ncbi:MAG: lactate racemase domain-containing protein [Lachnospiraceae bacterium]